ncbi:MAG TPA: fatty acid desaturase family protein [Caldimonas sp.]|jgi:fatty acid desaturase|nr:fatty acid desaturase family protein [Caldimonas sp.]
MEAGDRQGEEFRTDLRPLAKSSAGSGNASARRILSAAELAPLTELSDLRSLAAIAQTASVIALAIAFGVWAWPSPWVVLAIVVVGVEQHALFILAHEAAHYRLFRRRAVNDVVGRAIGMAGAISMCTYRVIHRLHHNNLYTAEDPDTAIHGGYPRGTAYLWKKLAQDTIGWNAWKTFAYFFGAPALNEETQRAARPLDDTSPQLRRAARIDRWFVVAFQIVAPLACLALGGWRGLAQYAAFWLVPMVTVLQPILRLRAICEHGAVSDFSSPLTAARSNRSGGGPVNVIGRAVLFPHHVNYHLEHHLYPAVPHYYLPRLHRLLVAKGALDGAEVRDLGETFGLIFAPRRARVLQREAA